VLDIQDAGHARKLSFNDWPLENSEQSVGCFFK
jgi:hypothetical protein